MSAPITSFEILVDAIQLRLKNDSGIEFTPKRLSKIMEVNRKTIKCALRYLMRVDDIKSRVRTPNSARKRIVYYV